MDEPDLEAAVREAEARKQSSVRYGAIKAVAAKHGIPYKTLVRVVAQRKEHRD